MRIWIAALGALLLALAPSARAQTRALAPAEQQGGPALAGDRVYWASSSPAGTLTVRSAPAAGGEDATVGTVDARGRAAARRDPPELFLTVRATDPDGRVSTVYDSIG